MIHMIRRSSPTVVSLAASAMLLLALAGSFVIDRLWLALVPATALLFLAVGAIRQAGDQGDGRLGALGAALSRIGCLGLLATAVAGGVVVAVHGVEPGWLLVAAFVSGGILVTGGLLLGIDLSARRTASRGAAILFALSLPIGIAIDYLPSVVFPAPFFTGAGIYVGLGLLAIAVARLGSPRNGGHG